MATFNREETIKLISDVAKEHGDKFRVSLRRRDSGRSMSTVAVFREATSEQCAYPETWVGSFSGGGEYWLTVCPEASPTAQIGGVITHVEPGTPIKPDVSVLNSGDWKGPPIIHWIQPEAKEVAQPQPQSQPSVTLTTPLPFDSEKANKMLAEKAEQLSKIERELAEKDKQIALMRKDVESSEREFKAKTDSFNERMRDRERELDRKIEEVRHGGNAKQSAQISEGVSEIGKTLLTGLFAMLDNMQKSSAEQRIERMKLELERQKAQAEIETRREQRDLDARKETLTLFTAMLKELRESQEKQSKELQEMIKAVQKQPGMDDQMKSVFGSMSQAFGQLANTTMSMVAAATQLQSQEQPSTDWASALTGIARSIADAAKEFFKTKAQAMAGLPPGTAPQLPAPAQAQQSDQRQAQPQPQPQQEEEPKPPTTVDDSAPIIDQLAARAKEKQDPVQIAAAFLNAVESNAWFKYKVHSAESLTDLFGPLLTDWVMEKVEERGPYLDQVGQAIEREAQKRRASEQARAARASQATQPAANA